MDDVHLEPPFQQEPEQRELAETLLVTGEAFSSTLDSKLILDNFLDLIARVVPYDTAAVMLIENQKALVINTRGFDHFGLVPDSQIKNTTFDLAKTANLAHISITLQPLLIDDVREYPGWLNLDSTNHIRSWVGAPIIVEGQLHAIFVLDKAEAGFYKRYHLTRLIAFASQAALALQNAKLFEATHRQLEELKVLHAVATAVTIALTEDSLISAITKIIGEALYPDNFGVLLLDNSRQTVSPHPSYHINQTYTLPKRVPMNLGVVGQVLQDQIPRRIPDVRDFAAYHPVDGRTRSELCVPLFVQGEIIGVINTESACINAFSEADERILTTIARQLGTGIEKYRLLISERTRRQEAETIHQANLAISHSLNLDETLKTLLDYLAQIVPYDSASIFLLEDKRRLALKAKREVGKYTYQAEMDEITFDLFENKTWYDIYVAQRSLMIADTKQDSRWVHLPATNYIRNWIGTPLLLGEDLIGFYSLDKAEPHFFTAVHVKNAEMLAAPAAVAIQNARLYAQVQHHAEELQEAVEKRTRELTVANKRLQELDRLKSKFISDISHELRTPATNLNLYLDLIERGQPEKQTQYVDILRSQVDRLNHLLEDILNLSRLELSGKTIAMKPVDVNMIISQVVAAYYPRILESKIELHTQLQSGLPPISGEVNQLAQVITNLLINAINYTSDGCVLIKTYANREKNQVIIKVKDTGIGIGPEDIDHVFQRFYRGKQTSQGDIPGTGLGLAIVKEIIDLHQGRINVTSLEGHGSTFTIWLPAYEDKNKDYKYE